MNTKVFTLAAASIALTAAPIAAQAAPSDRVAAPVSATSQLGGDGKIGPALIIAALAAVGIGILLISDDDDDDDAPVSA